jgi:hypothetical protein
LRADESGPSAQYEIVNDVLADVPAEPVAQAARPVAARARTVQRMAPGYSSEIGCGSPSPGGGSRH